MYQLKLAMTPHIKSPQTYHAVPCTFIATMKATLPNLDDDNETDKDPFIFVETGTFDDHIMLFDEITAKNTQLNSRRVCEIVVKEIRRTGTPPVPKARRLLDLARHHPQRPRHYLPSPYDLHAADVDDGLLRLGQPCAEGKIRRRRVRWHDPLISTEPTPSTSTLPLRSCLVKQPKIGVYTGPLEEILCQEKVIVKQIRYISVNSSSTQPCPVFKLTSVFIFIVCLLLNLFVFCLLALFYFGSRSM
jgi:hypothetical protein